MQLPEKYTRTAMVLHWLVATLIILNFLIVWTVDSMPKSFERPMIDLHKSFGITVLGLVLMRILWRLTHRPPPLPAAYPTWERLAAHGAHAALYVLILLQPLTGWIHDSAWKGAPQHPLWLYGFIPWFRIGAVQDMDPATTELMHALFGEIHGTLGTVLVVVFVVHVAGALKHQFLDREPELQRMLPGE
jgi:cytochrome b561